MRTPRGEMGMDALHGIDYGLDELRKVVATVDETDMDGATNCDPWTVRRLASHALNNQLFWAGLVSGQQIVSFEDAMGAVPIDGDLAVVAADVMARAATMWRTEGILEMIHTTPLGEVPGAVV